jgi:ComF family protein
MPPPWCARCGRQLRIAGTCRDCGEGRRRVDLIRAAFAYRGPLPGLVHALKYRRHRSIAKPLASWMAGALARFPELAGADAVTAVPLHPARLAERGFNQAALLADGLVSAYGRPLLETLERTANTRPQWRLGREQRAKNLRLAFRPKTDGRIAGKSFLLIDDVCTTGETLDNCAAALRAAGAVKVTAFVLARD